MKNILKKFLIIFIVFLLTISMTSISKAENKEIQPRTLADDNEALIEPHTSENDIMLIDNSEENTLEENLYSINKDNITVNQNVSGDAFILSGESVTIDSKISGNAFIISAKNVTINSNIAGNAFIIAPNNITLGKSGVIQNGLFSMSENLNIDGTIQGNVYSIAETFSLEENASLLLDLYAEFKDASIKGKINRDVNISCESVSFAQTASIGRNFNYTSTNELTIPENIIKGTTNFTKDINEEISSVVTPTVKMLDTLYKICCFITFVLVIFIITKWLGAKFTKEHVNFTKNVLIYALFGLIALIAIPILIIILLSIGITASLAWVLLALYILSLLVSSAVAIIVIANLCADKLKDRITMNNTVLKVLCLVGLCIVYKLLKFIPILGGLISFIIILIGIGILIKTILPEKFL